MRFVVQRSHLAALVIVASCAVATTLISQAPSPAFSRRARTADGFTQRLIAAANHRLDFTVRYEPKYVRLKYPGGDVPADTGVCTDEIVRIYRELGIDLQKEVHEDMVANFGLYPRSFGLKRPDSNIDHRRVPNLRVFFSRKGRSLPITDDPQDYLPGDLVTWDLGGGPTHIGIVVDKSFGPRYGIVHNIGAGPQLEDVLFAWKITGHYRYRGPVPATNR